MINAVPDLYMKKGVILATLLLALAAFCCTTIETDTRPWWSGDRNPGSCGIYGISIVFFYCCKRFPPPSVGKSSSCTAFCLTIPKAKALIFGRVDLTAKTSTYSSDKQLAHNFFSRRAFPAGKAGTDVSHPSSCLGHLSRHPTPRNERRLL